MTKPRSIPLLLGSLLLGACRADFAGLQTLEVGELVELRRLHSELLLCDANNAKTRGELGVVPGAQLLSSYRDYDLEAELGADQGRKLVFYCHSEMCSAAAEAARRAIAGGYTDVSVLAAGIEGWREAGQPVAHPSVAELGS